MQIKSSLGLAVVALVALLLTGCLSPSIKVAIDPIEINQGDKEIEIQMRFRLSGFARRYEITEIEGIIVDAEDNELFSFSEPMNSHFLVAPLVPVDRTVTISLEGADFYEALQDPERYANDLKGTFGELEVVLSGTTLSKGKTQIFFK